jgi:hypothetical protein
MSPDCIQNVDNSQPPRRASLSSVAIYAVSGEAARMGLRGPAALVEGLEDHRATADPEVIRIGAAAWRVAPRPQPAANRRTIAATSSSGTPTGQAAAAASRSGVSPSRSKEASPNPA